jgi:N-dimethylarginine dimethylaminohydrolase
MINVYNEYAPLKRVIVGRSNPNVDAGSQYSDNLTKLKRMLTGQGIDTVMQVTADEPADQIWCRDPFIAIGDTMVVSSDELRALPSEITNGANMLVYKYGLGGSTIPHELCNNANIKVVTPSPFLILEGGDIILHNDTIFVGNEGRGSQRATEFIEQHFSDKWNVVPLNLGINKNSWTIHHLDCTFMPLSSDEAIIYPSGLKKQSLDTLGQHFKSFIEINGDEQYELGANVLSIGNKKVVVQSRHTRIIQELEKRGYTVLPFNANKMTKGNGAIHCATCPIERGD